MICICDMCHDIHVHRSQISTHFLHKICVYLYGIYVFDTDKESLYKKDMYTTHRLYFGISSSFIKSADFTLSFIKSATKYPLKR